MKKYFFSFAVAAALVSCENPADKTTDATIKEEQTAAQGSGIQYTFTDASSIGFTGSKVTGSHSGGFKKFSGFFTLQDGSDAPNSGEITIDMDSTWSDSDKLTAHLKNADFFDVSTYPTSTFVVTDVNKTGSDIYEVSGNFTLHGVTKNITFPATASKDGKTAKVNATFDINRKDFGIVYAGKTDDLIRDEVVITFDLTAKAK